MTLYQIKTAYGFLPHHYDKITLIEKVARFLVQSGAEDWAYVYTVDADPEFILGFDESCRIEIEVTEE